MRCGCTGGFAACLVVGISFDGLKGTCRNVIDGLKGVVVSSHRHSLFFEIYEYAGSWIVTLVFVCPYRERRRAWRENKIGRVIKAALRLANKDNRICPSPTGWCLRRRERMCFDPHLSVPCHPFSMFSIYPSFGAEPCHPLLLSVALTRLVLVPSRHKMYKQTRWKRRAYGALGQEKVGQQVAIVRT